MYDALFVTDTDGKVQPSLVTDFSNSPDNLKLTLTLKDGVTFADGSTLDSDAGQGEPRRAQRTTKLLINGTLGAGGSQEITDVSAPDPKTVVITWKAPQAQGQNALADTNGVIVGQGRGREPRLAGHQARRLRALHPEHGQDHQGQHVHRWTRTPRRGAPATGPTTTSPSRSSPTRRRWPTRSSPVRPTSATQLDQTTVDLVNSKQTTTKVGGVIVGFPVFDKIGTTNPAFKDPNVRLALSYGTDRDGHRQGPAPGVQGDRAAVPVRLARLRRSR